MLSQTRRWRLPRLSSRKARALAWGMRSKTRWARPRTSSTTFATRSQKLRDASGGKRSLLLENRKRHKKEIGHVEVGPVNVGPTSNGSHQRLHRVMASKVPFVQLEAQGVLTRCTQWRRWAGAKIHRRRRRISRQLDCIMERRPRRIL